MTNKLVKEIVEDYYKLKIDSKTRQRKYVEARAVYYKLLRENSRMSLQAIGKTMNRDHATALHSIRKIKDWLEYDKQLRQDFNTINDRLQKVIEVNPDIQVESIEGFYEIEYKKLESKHTYILNKSIAEALAEEAKKYDTLLTKYKFIKSRLEKYDPKRMRNFN